MKSGELIVACDGGARGNPGPAGIGVVVTTSEGEVLGEVGKGIGWATNNVAEYQAAIEGLGLARGLGARKVELRSDSLLLVRQLAGQWRVKEPSLRRLHEQARKLIGEFDVVHFRHVAREQNGRADLLANRGMDEQGEVLPPPSASQGGLFSR
jgi:ribonuclease HI